MKQKLLNKLWLRVCMIAAVMTTALAGTAAADEDATISIGINPTNSTSSSYIVTDQEFTIDGVTFIMRNYNPSTGQIRGNQSSASSNFYLYNTTAIPGTLKSVTIEGATIVSSNSYINTGDDAITTPATSGTNPSGSTWSGLSGTYFCISMAKGGTSGTVKMNGVTITYTPSGGSGGNDQTVATPTFSPAEGTYTSAQNVTISTATDEATIYYTTDGSNPTTSSYVYSSAIPVSSTTTIKAMAVKDGYDDSDVASATYTIKTDPALSFSSATAEATIGQAFTAPTLTNSYGVDVTWNSSDEGVATVSDGTVTLEGEGTTTITASFAGDATYIASEASYTLTVTDPSVITLWSEDFSSYSADDVPNGGTYSYACTNGGGTTKIYNQASTGGTAPELLVGKNSGTFTAVVPLNNASGTLTLTYKTNAKAMSVSTTTEGISGGNSFSSSGEHTVTFTGVTTSMTSITIIFTATNSSDNVRLDDIELRGRAQAATVEAPTFSVNGGTYYTPQSVELSCATDGATIYYTTNGDEPTSSSTEYTSAITVSETMTIKAIAVKDGDQSTVSSATYTIAEKNDVVFSIADKSLAYGETYTVTKGTYAGRDVQTDGTVTVSTDNEAVASVSGMTITAEAVGTAIITLTAAEGDTYKAASTTIAITVTAPTGQTTAPAVPALFNETFDKCDGSGGRDDVYTGNIGTKATTDKLDESWATIGSNGASQCIKLGTGSAAGTVTTSNIALTGNGTLTFSAAGWGDSNSNTVTVTATGATLSGDTEVTMSNGEWNNYSVSITGAEGAVAITFSMKRGFLDDVKVVAEGSTAEPINATLNSSGYATFCSQYPLDFTGVTDFSAWQITDIDSDNKITFERVTGSVKGGTGLFLVGENDATVTIPSADSENELGSNMLEGTLAPMYFDAGAIYGLAGDTFKKNNAGTIRANKAYIDAGWITPSAGVKAFTLVFEDDATGIRTVETVNAEDAEQIFNLAGQRIQKMQKGINIVNGKKILK